MNNIPPQVFHEIQDAIRRPQGTFTFRYHSSDLFDPQTPGGVVLQIPSGGHLFRLERTDELFLEFYHSSPGTGTRVARIDLSDIVLSDDVFMAFSWSPREINLHLRSQAEGEQLHSAKGSPSDKQFIVGDDGCVYQLGGEGIDVMGARVYRVGEPTLIPPALDV